MNLFRLLAVSILPSVSLSVPLSAAELRAPDFALERAPQGIHASAPAGYHFNLKAPGELRTATARTTPLKTSTQKELWFESQGTATLVVKAYLCDDANTFCEPHEIKLPGDGAEPMASAQKSIPTAPPPPAGFITNDAPAALARAKAQKKPLLVDFFGIWCPPCNQLDEHVFSSPEFAREKDRFVLLRLDADSEASWELKARFKIGGYPTIVFASSEGEEVSRVVGFRPKEEFVQQMKLAWEQRDTPLVRLEARAKSGDRQALLRIVRAQIERKEFEAAWGLLEKALPGSSEWEEAYVARIGAITALQSKDEPTYTKRAPELIGLYEKAILKFPDSPDSVDWGRSLAELYQTAKRESDSKTALNEAATRAQRLARNPGLLRGRDYRPADLWSMAGGIFESLNDPVQAKAAWKNAASEYKKLRRSEDERGYNLELAYSLWKAGEAAESERIYRRLQALFPGEFTFWYAHASMKMRDKKPKEAKPLAESALRGAYGDNRLRSAKLLAEILLALDQKADAKKLVETELAQFNLPSDPSNRTHHYAKALRAVLVEK